jgi:radical SAM-linked protein
VQRLRVRYAKRGRLRFASHRDLARTMERGLRRAGVPVAFSAGFSPHPKISWIGAAPTGTASEAEYVEIAVVERLDPTQVRQSLDAALPPGFDVVEVVEATGGSLADRVAASQWAIRLDGVPTEVLAAAVAAFLAAPEVMVERLMKDGVRRFDARASVVSAVVESGAGDAASATTGASDVACATMRVVVRHSIPVVRPDDVMSALRQVAGLEPPVPPVATRLAQGLLDDGTGEIIDPLAADRTA